MNLKCDIPKTNRKQSSLSNMTIQHIDGHESKPAIFILTNCSGEPKNFRISLFFIIFLLFHNIM